MKNFKKVTLGVLGATLLTIGLYSCSNDNELTTVEQTDKKVLLARPYSDVLKEYYGKDLEALSSTNVYDSYGSYVLTKYAYPFNNFTDIYSLTDAKGDIEYLIELDRNAEVLKSLNILTSETINIGDLNKITQLKLSNYDLIDASISILASFPVFDGKKFWGWTCEETMVFDNTLGVFTECGLSCVYNVFWTTTGKEGVFNCDDESAKNYKVVNRITKEIN